MIDIDKIDEASYEELEESLREISQNRKELVGLGARIQERMDALAAEESAAKLVGKMSPAEREKVSQIIGAASE